MNEETSFNDHDGSIACERAAALYCEGRDRELLPTELLSLHAHIAGCVACQAASQQLRTVFEQLRLLVGGEEASP